MAKQQVKYNPPAKSKESRYSNNKNTKTNIFYLLPIIFILIVLPFIIRYYNYKTPLSKYPWFSISNEYVDFFLYYKQWSFVFISLVMVIILLSHYFKKKQNFQFIPIFIPLAIYAAFALLSSIISKYRNYSFTGLFSQFESVFVILGYCIVVYYVYIFVNTEADVALIIKWLLIGAFILGVLGITQILGHDFLATSIGRKLITPSSFWNSLDTIDYTFGQTWVYLAFNNPNYAAVYTALMIPIIFVLMLFLRKVDKILLYLLTLILLIVSLVGTQTLAGTIGLVAAALISLIIFWRPLLKYYFISAPILVIAIISLFAFNGLNNNILINKLHEVISIKATVAPLTDIQTKDDELVIKYQENTMRIAFIVDKAANCSFTFQDENYQPIANEYKASDGGSYVIQDLRFPGFIVASCIYNNTVSFVVTINEQQWFFTNQTEDGTYYYYNYYGRLDKIVTAPSALFTGYENIATKRGYIWSRSIPLLKDHILLGSGADTFVLEFPQQDYVNINNYSYSTQLITKPHNLYLQIAIQTGVISLLAVLIFYGMSFISSIRLYSKGKFRSYYAQVGVAIFIGSFSYMVTGLSNDSSITVAPIFWLLIGLGIAVNIKAKPFIQAEIKEQSTQK